MAKFEKVPEYVAATHQEVAAARTHLTLLRGNSAFALMQGARRAALQAKFNSGMKLSALEYAEFGDIVPAGFSTAINAGRFGTGRKAGGSSSGKLKRSLRRANVSDGQPRDR